MKHIVLGNGPAGVVAAETLREAAPADEVVLIGNEPEPPYSRMAIPYLLEENIRESGTYLRKSPDHFDKLNIRQHRGRAVALDAANQKLLFDDGHFETFDRLLVATGSRPIRPPIPGVDLPQVQTCWTLEDARAIARLAKPGARVLQLGAGFIGCIIMEALAKRGVKLTVVERGDRMVPRMMTPKAGGMIKRWVEEQGIRVVTSAGVERIDPTGAKPPEAGARMAMMMSQDPADNAAAMGDAPLKVKLSTGEEIPCDLVIVAAGVAPHVSFLEETPVHVASGVLVNERMETSVRGIYAAGDVAEAPDLFTGAHLVSAIQPNAVDQARVAALNMAGKSSRLAGVLAINVLDTLGLISTSFGQWWSSPDGEGVEQVDEANWRYLSLQFQGDVLVGATSIGRTEHVGALRGLIQGRVRLGDWKDRLMAAPQQFFEAYVARAQPQSVTGRA